jgi:hypothetical protein
MAQLDFTGNPLPHRTFEQMGRDFSPEGTFSHCDGCRKRVPTQSLVSEKTPSGFGSYCPNCRRSALASKTAQMPYEKYHREKNTGPEADDDAPIYEKQLPHREGFEQTLTEDQIKPEHEWSDSENPQVIEKVLETATSPYVTHRSDAAELTVPPINALVEKIRQKRLAEDYEEEKKPHWSHSFNEKKQQGSLPKWKKNAPQHDKPVLNNDPGRFSGTNADPTKFHTEKIQPLVGGITTADMDRVAFGIKTGRSMEYDNAILAILRLAHDERRNLTEVERKTVTNLKIARTNKLMEKC